MNPMLASLLGGLDVASMMPKLPCAIHLAECPTDDVPQGVTLAGGSLVCADHVTEALGLTGRAERADLVQLVNAQLGGPHGLLPTPAGGIGAQRDGADRG